MKYRRIPPRLEAFVFLLALTIIVYIYHPATQVKILACPFRLLTGLYCPGCGSIRAMTQLLQGNIFKAAKHNVLAVAFFPLLVWVTVGKVKLLITGKGLPSIPFTARWMRVLLALIILFTLLRNLPITQLAFLTP